MQQFAKYVVSHTANAHTMQPHANDFRWAWSLLALDSEPL